MCSPKVNGGRGQGGGGQPKEGEGAAFGSGSAPLTSSGAQPGRLARQRGDPSYPSPMAYIGIGMLNAICLLGGGALGLFLDRGIGTLPVFLLLGLLAGAGAGVAATRAELRRYKQ
jgi:hypothetical protein